MKARLFLVVTFALSAFGQNQVIIKDGGGSGNAAQVTAAAAVKVDGSAVTQPVSGTITITPSGTQAVSNAGTFAVQNTAATPAGSAIIGKVGIDQTTPGTTNGVQVNAALPAGANVIGHVIADTGSTTAVTQGTAANLNATVVGTGTLAVQVTTITAADPCFGTLKTGVSISQTTNTQIITGTSAKKIYFCAINIGPNADAENITLVEGTGTVCATNTIAIAGLPAATAANGWQNGASGGLTYGAGIGTLANTTVNADNVCLFQSGSGRVPGGISYVVQ